jgi:hypothetical protein
MTDEHDDMSWAAVPGAPEPDLGRLRAIGLDHLRHDGSPPTDGWAEVTRRAAAHRRNRRVLRAAAAAVVVLVLGIGVTTLLGPRDGAVPVATGPGHRAYLLPPEGVREVSVMELPAAFDGGWGTSYEIAFTDPDGRAVRLSTFAPGEGAPPERTTATTGPAADPTADTMVATVDPAQRQPAFIEPADWPVAELEVRPLERARLQCAPTYIDDRGMPITTDHPLYGQSWSGPDLVARFGPLDVFISLHDGEQLPPGSPCPLGEDVVGRFAAVVAELRVVDEEEFTAFMDLHGPMRHHPPEGDIDRGPIRPPSAPVPDEQAQRDAITAAVLGIARREPSGYPHLVGGEADAAEYDQMFDEMRERLGGAPAAEFEVTDIWFVSELRADVAFVVTVQLPTGPFTADFHGSVYREDGRWQVSRSTIDELAARTTLPLPTAPTS